MAITADDPVEQLYRAECDTDPSHTVVGSDKLVGSYCQKCFNKWKTKELA